MKSTTSPQPNTVNLANALSYADLSKEILRICKRTPCKIVSVFGYDKATRLKIKIPLYALDCNGYILKQFQNYGVFIKHQCFKKKSLRSEILQNLNRVGKPIYIKTRSNLQYMPTESVNSEGLHFYHNKIADKVKTIFGRYEEVHHKRIR